MNPPRCASHAMAALSPTSGTLTRPNSRLVTSQIARKETAVRLRRSSGMVSTGRWGGNCQG